MPSPAERRRHHADASGKRSATTRRTEYDLQNPSSRALYLFPTKALAQDQLADSR